MDFSLSDDQEQAVRALGRWVERRWAGADEANGADVHLRRARWTELQANGWTGLLTPEAMPVLDAALMVEQLAHGGCPLPIGPGALVAPLVATAGALGAGPGVDQLVAVDHSDPGAATARGLELADRIVVLAATPNGDGRRHWWAAGVSVGPGATVVAQDEGQMVLSRLTSPIEPATRQPLDPATGELIWLVGAVLSAAELVGLARAVLDGCVAYAKVRVQGGKPIGGHQAVQHRLVDMLGAIERARYLTYQAAATVAERAATFAAGDVVPAVHQAKALAARDCLAAIRSGHQVMGAIAYSAEHELHHRHKQAIVVAHEFGAAARHWEALERAAGPAPSRPNSSPEVSRPGGS